MVKGIIVRSMASLRPIRSQMKPIGKHIIRAPRVMKEPIQPYWSELTGMSLRSPFSNWSLVTFPVKPMTVPAATDPMHTTRTHRMEEWKMKEEEK